MQFKARSVVNKENNLWTISHETEDSSVISVYMLF